MTYNTQMSGEEKSFDHEYENTKNTKNTMNTFSLKTWELLLFWDWFGEGFWSGRTHFVQGNKSVFEEV